MNQIVSNINYEKMITLFNSNLHQKLISDKQLLKSIQ